MEFLLSKVTQQAMNYAIRSGVTITSGYAISQCSRLMKTQDGRERQELAALQRRLDNKIKIISPAIDMIELMTARGNTSLESCMSLTKNLRLDIQALGARLASAAADEEASLRKGAKAKSKVLRDQELRLVIADMKALLQRLEDAVPLINLAITTSGVSLSTNLPASISPSRLLQASTFLSAGDACYATNPNQKAQVGPTFTFSMYMLFAGYASQLEDEESLRTTTWQEVIHKARLKLIRTPISELSHYLPSGTPDGEWQDRKNSASHMAAAASADEFAYQLNIVEDMDDGRVHTIEEEEMHPNSFDDVNMAGIREAVPIHEISKIFYADTGKILNIGSDGESNNPILLLKRDINAIPPRRMMEREQEDDFFGAGQDGSTAAQNAKDQLSQDSETEIRREEKTRDHWRLPSGLDPEWIAFEVFVDEPESDSESEMGPDEVEEVSPTVLRPNAAPERSSGPGLTARLSGLRLSSSPPPRDEVTHSPQPSDLRPNNHSLSGSGIRTSLSLLEMLIRLTSLQQFQQASHLTINDELLNFFLEESSTTGAASGDTDQRKRIRADARQKVGFDPYDESPIKRRGEQYQYRQDGEWQQSPSASWNEPSRQSPRESNPRFNQSPLLLHSQEHSSRPQSSTPISSPQSKTTPFCRSFGSLATPPGTTTSRKTFLKVETVVPSRGSSNSLARDESQSSP